MAKIVNLFFTFGLLGVPEVLAFTGVDLVFTKDSRFGGVFFAAGVKTGGLAFTFLGTGTGDGGAG